MRANEFLSESATSVLFHYCSPRSAVKILSDGVFKLSNSTATDIERKLAPPGYPYYLSLTRSKVGDYHRFIGTAGCMFVIDGDKLNHKYKTKPVDYWERMWNTENSGRTRESEDRVFSKIPEIPIDCVRSIHVLLKEQHEHRSAEVRQLLILSKRHHIPAFLYTNENAWRTQNTAKAVSPSETGTLLRGSPTTGYHSLRTNYIEPWLELLHKNKKEDLTKRADKLRYNLMYYGDTSSSLENDMHNARKPESGDEYITANKLTDYMMKNKMTIRQFVDSLKEKWSKIG